MKIIFKRSLLSALFMVSLFFISSCGDDEGQVSASYEFKEQEAQGEVEGVTFNLGGTRADVNQDQNVIDIEFYSTLENLDNGVCSVFFGDEINIFTTVPNAVGLYEINLDANDLFNSQTVTFYNPNTNVNVLAPEGAIEILTITETEITGRIDARGDANSFLNGNFTAEICQ